MEDHEVRDVLNRATTPDASIRFGFRLSMSVGERKQYILLPFVKNSGSQVINNFKLTMKFPRFVGPGESIIHWQQNIQIHFDKAGDYFIDYQSTGVLFPDEERNIGEELQWKYDVSNATVAKFKELEAKGSDAVISWTLYADNMTPKHGTVRLSELHDF